MAKRIGEEEKEEEEQRALIKSNNPQLAGGEIQNAHELRRQLPPVPDLQAQSCDLFARDEPRWTKAMER